MSLTVLIAPSGFKECLDATGVADAMAHGVCRAWPDATILKAPIADGGEGFARALCDATGGRLHEATVTGPVGAPVVATYGFLGGEQKHTAVLEIAAACGLSLVPRDRRDPTLTTSYGVGELIRAALDRGARRILIGCGDSGVNDGGAGLLQALGASLKRADGSEIGHGGGELIHLDTVDLRGLDPRLAGVPVDVAVNWSNALLGERGVSRVYGPQKGATSEQIPVLDEGLRTLSVCLQAATGVDVAAMNGSGASGGIGAGLAGGVRAQLLPRFDVIFRYVALNELLQQADLVLTAEGSIDGQTPHGKVPAELGRRARALGVPVMALAGTIGAGAHANLHQGIAAFTSIQPGPISFDDALDNAKTLLRDASEMAMRTIAIGMDLRSRIDREHGAAASNVVPLSRQIHPRREKYSRRILPRLVPRELA